MLKNHPRAATVGFVFGLISPLVGVFLGLQVSSTLGTLFAFPLIVAGWLIGEPFGQLSTLARVATLLISGCVWCAVFTWIAAVLNRRSS